MQFTSLISRILNTNLITQIAVGILAGIALGLLSPRGAEQAAMLGNLFVQALKAVAPLLVFILVASAIANQNSEAKGQMRPIIGLYLIGTLSAAIIAVVLSMVFPSELALTLTSQSLDAPQGVGEVLQNLLFKLVDNPINALLTGNFIGILVWGIALGIGLKQAQASTKQVFADVSHGISMLVSLAW